MQLKKSAAIIAVAVVTSPVFAHAGKTVGFSADPIKTGVVAPVTGIPGQVKIGGQVGNGLRGSQQTSIPAETVVPGVVPEEIGGGYITSGDVLPWGKSDNGASKVGTVGILDKVSDGSDRNTPLAVITSKDADAGALEAALGEVYNHNGVRSSKDDVEGRTAPAGSLLVKAGRISGRRMSTEPLVTRISAAVENATAAGFWGDLWRRLVAVFKGKAARAVERVENVKDLVAKRKAELDMMGPELNRKVALASTQVKLLDAQIKENEAKIAEFTELINEGSDLEGNEEHDKGLLALINQKSAEETSLEKNRAQRKNANDILEAMKADREGFAAQKEDEINKLKGSVRDIEYAKMRKDLAELRGSMQVGQGSDTTDTVVRMAQEAKAEADGMTDSIESTGQNAVVKVQKAVANKKAMEELQRIRAARQQKSDIAQDKEARREDAPRQKEL